MPNPEHRLPDRPGGDDPGRGRRLGIDVGSVRIGVAVSDPDGILATPVETVRRDTNGSPPATTDPARRRTGGGRGGRRTATYARRPDRSVRGGRHRPRRGSGATRRADAGADGRRTADHCHRTTLAAGSRCPGKGTEGDDRPGRGRRNTAELAGSAAGAYATRSAMPDAWDRERPQPVAVGPPRRRLSRADRIREARRRRRRRVVRGCHAVRLRRHRGRGRLPRFAAVAHRVRRGLRLLGRRASRTSSSRSTTATRRRRSGRRWKTTRWSRRRRAFVTAARRQFGDLRRSSPASTRCAPRYRQRMPLRG